MSFSLVTIKVDGKEVSVDTRVKLGIVDISEGMDKVAAEMAYWGSVWAAAEKESIEVEAAYRTWRAQFAERVLAEDPKLAEWKVKQKIESDPRFIKFKTAQAVAKRNATVTKSTFESYKTKASMLQSKGAMSRAELDATSMRTPEKSKRNRSTVAVDTARDKMRSINKNKKRK